MRLKKNHSAMEDTKLRVLPQPLPIMKLALLSLKLLLPRGRLLV